DHLAVAQAQVLPGTSLVRRLVHTVPDRQIGTNDAGAGADIDDVRIRWCDSDGTDRSRRLIVEERYPVGAVVRRSPDTAVVETGVEDVGVVRVSGERARASRARRPDVAPAHVSKRQILGDGCSRMNANEDDKSDEDETVAHARILTVFKTTAIDHS